MTNAEARFSNSLRPRKPEGSLGRTAQDGHLDSHTAPELCEKTHTHNLTPAVWFIKAVSDTAGDPDTSQYSRKPRNSCNSLQVKSSQVYQKPQWGYMKEHQWKNIWYDTAVNIKYKHLQQKETNGNKNENKIVRMSKTKTTTSNQRKIINQNKS